MLDWSGVSVCEDEVLLNTALDACAAHRDAGRLRRILEELKMSGVRPKVQTYGLLIRACSVLRDLRGCWAFWRRRQCSATFLPKRSSAGGVVLRIPVPLACRV